jgi:hypothetical protein
MSKSALRIFLTVLMYFGVVVFLYPYVVGTLSSGIFLLMAGAGLTVTCGLLRCFLTEGDCNKHPVSKPAP